EFMQKITTGCSAAPRRWQRRFASRLALCGLASFAAGRIGSAQAGDTAYDFNPPNDDPVKGGFVLFGTNTNGWQTSGDGFEEITPALNCQNLGVLSPLDSLTALPVKGFELDIDIRTGNASGNNGRPADGFSISFVS